MQNKQPTVKIENFILDGPKDQKMFFEMLDLLEKLTDYSGGFEVTMNNVFSGFKQCNYTGHPRSIRSVMLQMILHKQEGDQIAADKLAAGTHIQHAKEKNN